MPDETTTDKQDRLGKLFDFSKGTLYNGMSKLSERELLFALLVLVVSFLFVPELFRLFAQELLTWNASESLVVWSLGGFAVVLSVAVVCSTALAGVYIWSRTRIKQEGR